MLSASVSDYFYMHLLYQVQGMHFDMAALSKPSIWGEASRIVNEEGFRAFWKGNLVTIAHRLPYSAVNFYAYERYKNVTSDALCIIFMRSGICCLCFLSLNQFHSLYSVTATAYIYGGESTRKYQCRSVCALRGWWFVWHNICYSYISFGFGENTTCSTGNYQLSLVEEFWGSVACIMRWLYFNWHLLFH